jgi:hypothetical protein
MIYSFLPFIIFPLFVFFGAIILSFFVFLYFLSPSPRAFVFGFLRYVLYGFCLLLLLVALGIFLDIFLSKMGFASSYEVATWDFDQLRMSLVLLLLAVAGFFFLKKFFFSRVAFFYDPQEKKSALLFSSAIMNSIVAKVSFSLLLVLGFLLLDYCLSFVLAESNHKDTEQFFVNFLSFLFPFLVLLATFFFKNSILLPKKESGQMGIFFVVVFTLSELVLLFTLGILSFNWLEHLFDIGSPLSATSLRSVFIFFLLSLGINVFILFTKFMIFSPLSLSQRQDQSLEQKDS